MLSVRLTGMARALALQAHSPEAEQLSFEERLGLLVNSEAAAGAGNRSGGWQLREVIGVVGEDRCAGDRRLVAGTADRPGDTRLRLGGMG